MTNALEMGKELTKRLKPFGFKGELESVYEVSEKIETLEQAIETCKYLSLQIEEIENRKDPHFCPIGATLLKITYNKICDRFPAAEKVGKKYELPEKDLKYFISFLITLFEKF